MKRIVELILWAVLLVLVGWFLSVEFAFSAPQHGRFAGITADVMSAVKAANEKEIEEVKIEKMSESPEFEEPYEKIFGYIPSDEEVALLKRVAMAEGGYTESLEGIVAIFCVVANRVNDPRFPDTIAGVLNQPYQFETVTTGRIWQYEVNEKVQEAYYVFLTDGYDDYPGICFFTAGYFNPYCEPAFILGNHYFSR